MRMQSTFCRLLMPRKTLPPTSTYIPQHTGYTYPCFLVCPCLEGPQQRKRRFPKFSLGRNNASELFGKNVLWPKKCENRGFPKKTGVFRSFPGFSGVFLFPKKVFPPGSFGRTSRSPPTPLSPNPFATAAAMRTSVPPAWVGHPGTNVLDVKVAHRGGAPRRRTEAHTLIALGCLMETL